MGLCRLVLVLACAASATACASSSTNARVRDIDGNPLPSYALGDTAAPVYKIRCEDGQGYLIVTDRTAHFNYTPGFGKVIRIVKPSLTVADMCYRIQLSQL